LFAACALKGGEATLKKYSWGARLLA